MRAVKGRRVGGIKNQNKINQYTPLQYLFQVFGTEQETQIPALRSYIHQMTEVRHRSSMERILQTVAQFVFDIQNYLTEAETVQVSIH